MPLGTVVRLKGMTTPRRMWHKGRWLDQDEWIVADRTKLDQVPQLEMLITWYASGYDNSTDGWKGAHAYAHVYPPVTDNPKTKEDEGGAVYRDDDGSYSFGLTPFCDERGDLLPWERHRKWICR